MASALHSRAPSSIVSSASTTLRRRLPLVGALCVLSLGFPNLAPSLSSSIKTGCAQSLIRLRFARQSSNQRVQWFSRMADSESSVPSIVVYVTVPNKEAGLKLATSIIKEKLAACVNRVPGVESVYEWKGEVQTDSEELLIIKTRESLLDALTEHVKANHEYELPEVIAMPIVGGSLQYLEWIKNNTKG
ncbi:hypothetical protein Scep_020400 [Stephania cephalantha]|uniref:Protein CutA, chloroplastic n=1 Tax=Stephania cephalantha TaxID=152367 RepID=A0AAP0ICJ3_9MAGN